MMILDVMLPGRDGFEILATLRQRGMKTPVLLLTSRHAGGSGARSGYRRRRLSGEAVRVP
jgi:CheY-like chemotaxis protein